MSEANIVLVKRFLQTEDLTRFLSFLEPSAEVDVSALKRPYAGIYRGHEQITTLFHEMNDPWREVQYETSEPLARDDYVVVDLTRTTKSLAGIAVQAKVTVDVTARLGMIIRAKVFPSRADALLARGWAAEAASS